ncbi:MAG: hypothetical protein JO316_10345 [Abitibacteriaceae bacterium]|nr:hypothetical protein [Abditibacteriaceae bacterium]
MSAFAIDVHYHLEQTGLFSKITIKKTGLPKCAFNIICSLADGSITQAEVTAVLEQVWNEAPLGYYKGENSYKLTASTEEVQMQFATSTAEASITGRIEVVGFQ